MRPELGVKQMGISLNTLKTPVEFGNSQNDLVKVVIALAVIEILNESLE